MTIIKDMQAHRTELRKLAVRTKEAEYKIKADALTTLLGDVTSVGVERGIECLDDAMLVTIRKYISNAKDTVGALSDGDARILKLKYEIEMFETYLPTQLTEAQMFEKANEAIAETEATSMRDMGKVMSYISEDCGQSVDKGIMSGIVKNILMS